MGGETPNIARLGPAFEDSAARLGATPGQAMVAAALTVLLVGALIAAPAGAVACLVVGVQALFLLAAAWRLLLMGLSARPPRQGADPGTWPRYTVLCALHDEAEVLPQLVERLSQIDYPPERLEGFLVLEADDEATIAAARATPRPQWLRLLLVPEGHPRTKPRALNHALALSTGDLVTIYDAEDDPDPLQLREAARRFADDPGLGAVQAPLRIRRKHKTAEPSPFVDRQFAAEYAALFEVVLPGMAALGLPFPLGGTSNHLRAQALREVGGWDGFNVTEDADLGFRLWRAGWRSGVIARPTYETPPGGVRAWLPQRTRWLKGFMQTWGVHTRRPSELGWRGFASLGVTLGMSLLSALAHAPAIAWLVSALMLAVTAKVSPATPAMAIGVLCTGAVSAWIVTWVGARRANIPYGPFDMLAAPAYWSMLTLAFVHAVWRLATEPHAWDKTPHLPDRPAVIEDTAAPATGRRAA
ncbi:glycosyltransferase family 2 protein [Brevundimonas sp.]|uniref:glycosyltransferase family 2 protein n=1 Tax=Brevundimonas sp. TaxID=1871086 RepID=UPI0025BCCA48|nr:glycosyltransferase family 2 protein [Brevundimonas sp.]